MTLQNISPEADQSSLRQALAHARVQAFIDAYQRDGYRIADIDPLGTISIPDIPHLQARYHRLSDDDIALAQHHLVGGLGLSSTTELTHQLRRLFCAGLAVDCTGVQHEARREWLFARFHASHHEPAISAHERIALLSRLVAAEQWEHCLEQDCPMAKRFSLEGCESLLLLMDSLVERASLYRLDKFFLAMPHRGRLNMLVNLMHFPPADVMAYFDGCASSVGTFDLPYHLGHETVRPTAHGDIALLLTPNPSHLESVYPVLLGRTRCYRSEFPDSPVPVSVVIHGDAAFCGQGVVMESLRLAQHPGYAVDGTIHVIINNQIGFTTLNPLDPEHHFYCTDIARIVGAPVLRVNADQPERVTQAARIAFDYRMQFHCDVVIDLVGYRRHGHAEQDIAAVTQPLLHALIDKHPSVTALYAQVIRPDPGDAAALLATARQQACEGFRDIPSERNDGPVSLSSLLPADATQLQGCGEMRGFVERMTALPPDFRAHTAIDMLIAQWRASVADRHAACDWTFAENMAYASLLSRGHALRISGMDVQRGTFKHRHAVWHAVDTARGVQTEFWPLRQVATDDAQLEIINSPLSEEAVLGFEYGFSAQASRPGLVIWEAQFGDFVNGAQIMIDQYIASGRGKWGDQSALTMLLPHGYEGVGPEHSTGYLSRMLLLCGQNNIRVACPSTSAQWFHLLRHQALHGDKPLLVFTPKAMLHGEQGSCSALADLIEGHFQPLMADRDQLPAAHVRRVVLCSGKVYYDLQRGREVSGDERTLLMSVEELYPFPSARLREALERYAGLEEVIWVQEEERSQGAWLCVRESIEACLPAQVRLRSICRPNTGSGPTASKALYHAEQADLVCEVFHRPPAVMIGRSGI